MAARPERASSGLIFSRPAEVSRPSTGMTAVRRLGARAASGPSEAPPALARVRLSARPEQREALRAAAGPHAEATARGAALHEAGEPRVARVRRAAASDERVQLSVQDLSAAVLSALSALSHFRFRRMAQPARVGPARIVRAMASSSTTRQ
ncbi:hypothetical protein V4R08_12635 [Nitrobacter sp. NHB1]